MSEREILIEATRREIRLIPNGPYLRMEAVDDVEPAFEKILVQNKAALMRLLKGKRHLARQVIEDEFCGCDREQLHEVLELLIENLHDPVCRDAIERLARTASHK